MSSVNGARDSLGLSNHMLPPALPTVKTVFAWAIHCGSWGAKEPISGAATSGQLRHAAQTLPVGGRWAVSCVGRFSYRHAGEMCLTDVQTVRGTGEPKWCHTPPVILVTCATERTLHCYQLHPTLNGCNQKRWKSLYKVDIFILSTHMES